MIRKYREEEIPKLISIWELSAALAHPFLTDDFSAMVKRAMTEVYLPDSDTWVYEEEGSVVAFISMAKNEIGGLFVHPAHHSKGIGTALVKYISRFHQVLEVEVFAKNSIGKPFYEKHGFTEIKVYYLAEADQKVIRMSKKVLS